MPLDGASMPCSTANRKTCASAMYCGGGCEADFRLVGCRGEITDVLITAFLAADYYVKLHAGPYGGPLTFNYFCVDNEGMSYVPKKAGIYAEPSFNPGPEGNRITFRGGYYSDTCLPARQWWS